MPDSTLERTVRATTQIEQTLRALGGSGSGISELLDSLDGGLPKGLVERIRRVATIRNRFVHEHGYSLSATAEISFLLELESITGDLSTLGAIEGDAATEERLAMPEPVPGVEIHRITPLMRLRRWPSTADRRLILFRGAFSEVLPVDPAGHKIPWTRVTALAYVRMAPFRVDRTTWSIATLDGISVDVCVSAAVQPRSNESSLARLAAAKEWGAELELVLERIYRTFQGIVSTTALDKLPNLNAVQSQAEQELVDVEFPETAFRVVSVTLATLQPSDQRVREFALQRRASSIERAHLEDRQEIERLEATRRRENARLDWQQELETLRAKHLLELESARTQVEIDAANRDFELAKLRLQLEFDEKVAQHKMAAEVAKTDRIQIEKILPLAIRAATSDGRHQLLAEMAKRQGILPANYQVNLALTDPEAPTLGDSDGNSRDESDESQDTD